jgi:hypothetical protein
MHGKNILLIACFIGLVLGGSSMNDSENES